MRRNYGGKLGETVHDLAKEKNRAIYGPGWNANVFEPGGVWRAGRLWDRFRASLPEWERTASKFLDACQAIGREADWDEGIKFDESGQSPQGQLVMLQVQKGKFVSVWPSEIAAANPVALSISMNAVVVDGMKTG